MKGWVGLVRSAPVTTFFALAAVTQVILVSLQFYDVKTHGLSLLRLPAPAILGVAVAAVVWGKKRATKLVSSLGVWRVHPGYYVFALTYPTAVSLAALCLLRLVGLNHGIEVDWESISGWDFFFLCVRIATVEEIAWVGFTLFAFGLRYRLFHAASLMGLLWGIWYIPLILADIQVTPGLPIVPLLINFTTIGMICAWLYKRTQSAGVVFIMQLTTNYTTQLFPVLPQRGGIVQYVAFVLLKGVFAVALYLIWGPKPLFGKVPEGTSSVTSLEAS